MKVRRFIFCSGIKESSESWNNALGVNKVCIFFGCFVFLEHYVFQFQFNSISTPEETKSGSKVANVLKDLKLEEQEFIDRRAYLTSESTKRYFSLDIHTGDILINDRLGHSV